MTALFLSFICLLLIVSNLSAQTRWQLATEGKDIEVYYDRGGISRTTRGIAKAWIKYVHKRESVVIKHSISLEEFQCNERMNRTLSYTEYNRSGEVIHSTTASNIRWDFVIPDSIGETLFGIICDGKKDLHSRLNENAEMQRAKSETYRLAQRYYQQGNDFREKGRNLDAVKAYKQAIQLKPDNAVFHYSLGETYVELTHNRLAIISFQQSIRVDPKWELSYTSLVRLLNKLSRFNEAIGVYEQAIRAIPDASSLYTDLGELYEQLSRHADALKLFKQQIRVFPDDTSAYINLGDVYEGMNKHTEATDAYRKAVEVAKGEVVKRPESYSYWKLAWAQRKLSLFDDVVETYRQAIKLFPEDCDLYASLGESYEKVGKLPEAAKAYEQAITHKQIRTTNEYHCSLEILYLSLGSTYVRLKHNKEAIVAYQQALTLSPNMSWPNVELGKLYEAEGRNNEALAAYKKAIDLDKNSKSGHLALGKFYLKLGDMNAAIEEYKKLKLINEKIAYELYKLIYN